MVEFLASMWHGMLLRCPSCRKGRIYRTFTQMYPACTQCGHRFEREEGDWLGAICIAYSITAVLIAAGVFLMNLIADVSATAQLIIWITFGVVFLLLCYRNMKGIWLGILHYMVRYWNQDPQIR